MLGIDSWISFYLSKLSDAKFSMLYFIYLVRGWKEKLYFDHSWDLQGTKRFMGQVTMERKWITPMCLLCMVTKLMEAAGFSLVPFSGWI